jgi:hypothetical protein
VITSETKAKTPLLNLKLTVHLFGAAALLFAPAGCVTPPPRPAPEASAPPPYAHDALTSHYIGINAHDAPDLYRQMHLNPPAPSPIDNLYAPQAAAPSLPKGQLAPTPNPLTRYYSAAEPAAAPVNAPALTRRDFVDADGFARHNPPWLQSQYGAAKNTRGTRAPKKAAAASTDFDRAVKVSVPKAPPKR